MQARPDVVAEHTRQAQHKQQHAVDGGGLFPAPAEGVHADGKDVFKNSQHRREAGENHEQEEQRPPEAAARHVCKDVRERPENERRAVVRLHTEGEARRENDRSGHQRHKGVQHTDAHGLARQRVLVRHIASEDLHGGNAEAQGKERLIHGRRDRRAESVFPDPIERRHQIEAHSLRRAGQRQTVNSQQHDQCQQRQHHELGDALKAVLQAEAANKEARNDDKLRPEAHLAGVCQHFAENIADGLGVHAAAERAGQEFPEINDHPAGDGGVVHHQQEAADQAEPAVDVPLLSGLFQLAVGQHGAFASCAADGQLHRQNRHAHDQQADQIQEDKESAAVFAGDIGKAPDIADADGAARADEQKPEAGTEGFALHDKNLPLK